MTNLSDAELIGTPVAPSERSARLAEYLGQLMREKVKVTSLEQIEGGFSRYTYRALIEDQRGEQRTFALRAEAGDSVLETDLGREFAIVRALSDHGFVLPDVLGFEATGEVLGRRFITTAWAAGSAINPWRTKDESRAAQDEQLCRSWIADIATLHAIDPDILRSAGVDDNVEAETYLKHEIDYWICRIRRADHHPGPLVEVVCAWLERSLPAGGGTSIVHGDLRIGNMLVSGAQVTAFLDWEMAAVGDWRADVGYCLMPYHAGKLLAPIDPSSNGLVHPREFLELYTGVTGRRLSDDEVAYFIVLGCVKMISILCTGIDAYLSHRNSDPRLAWLNIAIPGLVQDALDLMEKGLPW